MNVLTEGAKHGAVCVRLDDAVGLVNLTLRVLHGAYLEAEVLTDGEMAALRTAAAKLADALNDLEGFIGPYVERSGVELA